MVPLQTVGFGFQGKLDDMDGKKKSFQNNVRSEKRSLNLRQVRLRKVD